MGQGSRTRMSDDTVKAVTLTWYFILFVIFYLFLGWVLQL